jgi:hypothetical protein
MFRRRREPEPPAPPVDLSTVAPAWRPAVADALDARQRFLRIVGRVPAGPVSRRLDDLGARIDQGVLAAHHLATRAEAHAATLADLRPEALTARVKDARRAVSAAEAAGRDAAAERATLDGLLAQHAAAMRVWDAVDESRDRLARVNRRLEEAVVHAAAVSTGGGVDDPALALVEADLAAVGDELTALGSALDSLGPR